MIGKTDDDVKAELISFFDSLPEAELKNLAAKIEIDRNVHKFGIPHDAIMALLRPSLCIIHAPRIPTPQRALCEPFEDNLINRDGSEKEEGRIARASIAAMYDWLKDDLIPEEYEEISNAFILAQKKGMAKEAKLLTHLLWQESAKAMWHSLGRDDSPESIDSAVIERLGGLNRVMDIREMAAFLEIAKHVETIRSKLDEKPIDDLSIEEIQAVHHEYDAVASQFPGQEDYLLLSVMGRLTSPFPIVKVIKEIAANGNEEILDGTQMGATGAVLFSALEEEAAVACAAMSEPDIPETKISRKVKQFAESYKNLAGELSMDKNSAFGKRLHDAREAVCAVVETRILANAEETVLSVLSNSSGELAVELDDWPDDKAFEIGERRAQALAETLRVSEQLGIHGACLSKANGLRKQLSQHSEAIIQKLRSVKAEGIGMAGAHLATAVRLLELVAGPEEADSYRQRGETELMAAIEKQEQKTYAL